MRILFMLPVLLALAGCEFTGEDWGHSDRFKADFHQTYPLKAGNRVSLENTNGGVEITGWDQETVDVTAVRYAATEDLLQQVKIDVTAGTDAVRIRTVRPLDRNRGGWGVKYTIRVPRKTEIDRLESTNGSLRLESLAGPARLRTTNGSVKLNAIDGVVKAETTNGSITADDLRGGIEAESTNGSVRINLASVMDAGAIRLETTNGAIELTAAKLAGNPIHCDTTNGSITLRLPTDVKAQVKGRTSNSRIHSDFDIAGEFDSKRRSVDGTINGGGPLIELSTSNGAIRIEKR